MYEPSPHRKRWTREECVELVDKGLLNGRYELILGEIVSKMGQKRPHAITLLLLCQWLSRVFGMEFVQSQLPIDVSPSENCSSEPEPDVVVTKEPVTIYLSRNPGPADLVLVVEVSDTTVRFDLITKAALYARAEIPEYWVVDVNAREVIVHRLPKAGDYREVTRLGEDQTVAPDGRHDSAVAISDLLPPL